MASFFIFADVIKNQFLVCKLHVTESMTYDSSMTSLINCYMWPNQWRHQLSSFNKGYRWYKFQVHTMFRTWDTREVYTPPCTHTISRKRYTLEGLSLQSWTMNCRLSWYWDPLPLNNVVGVQRAVMVNVNSAATLFRGREVKAYSFIVQDCLNFLNFKSLDYTLKN